MSFTRRTSGSLLIVSSLLFGCSGSQGGAAAPAAKGEEAPAAAPSATAEAKAASPAAAKADFAALIGTDRDTDNLEVFAALRPDMTRDDVAKVFPSATEIKRNHVEVAIDRPGVKKADLRFAMAEGQLKLSGASLHFTPEASVEGEWEALVKAVEAKAGPVPKDKDRNAPEIDWDVGLDAAEIKVRKGSGGFEIETTVDRRPGKGGAFDAAAFVGDGKGNVPAFFAPFKATTTKDEIIAAMRDSADNIRAYSEQVIVYPKAGSPYSDIDFRFKNGKLHIIEVTLHRSISSRAGVIAARDAFAKKIGKARAHPPGASDADAKDFRWDAAKMVIWMPAETIRINRQL
jgi:hypothetical protein